MIARSACLIEQRANTCICAQWNYGNFCLQFRLITLHCADAPFRVISSCRFYSKRLMWIVGAGYDSQTLRFSIFAAHKFLFQSRNASVNFWKSPKFLHCKRQHLRTWVSFESISGNFDIFDWSAQSLSVYMNFGDDYDNAQSLRVCEFGGRGR